MASSPSLHLSVRSSRAAEVFERLPLVVGPRSRLNCILGTTLEEEAKKRVVEEHVRNVPRDGVDQTTVICQKSVDSPHVQQLLKRLQQRLPKMPVEPRVL